MNFLYTIDAQAAWNYEQSLLAQLHKHKQQLHKQSQEDYIKGTIDQRHSELETATAVGDFIQHHYAEKDSVVFHKIMFRNEKNQETARTRLYLAQDRLARFNAHHNKSPAQRRRPASAKERREANNYIDELFAKAQLNVAIGNVPNVPSRRRYSIPHTIRE